MLRSRTVPVVIAVAALLASCTSTATEPTPTPSASAPSTPSSTTPSPSPEPVGAREPVWEAVLGAESWTAPAAAGDLALVGADDGVLYALNAADGTVAWTLETPAPVRSAATVDGDAAYVVSDDGAVRAVSLDGAELWSASMGDGAERGDYDNYGSRPAVADGIVYASGMAGIVVALDAADGTELWRHDMEGPVEAGIAVADGLVHVTSMSRRHAALDATTGEVVWDLPLTGPGTTTPQVIDDVVAVGSRGAALLARDAATGEKLWTGLFGSSWVQSGAVDTGDGTAFAIGSSDLGVVRSYALDSGEIVWNAELGGWPWAVPAQADGVVYATSVRLDYQQPWEAAVHALDAATGEVLWYGGGGPALTWAPDGYAAFGAGAGPGVVGDLVVVPGLDGVVRAYAR